MRFCALFGLPVPVRPTVLPRCSNRDIIEIRDFKFDDGTIFSVPNPPVGEKLLADESKVADGLEQLWRLLPQDVITYLIERYIPAKFSGDLRLVCKQFKAWTDEPLVWYNKTIGRFRDAAGDYITKPTFEKEDSLQLYKVSHADHLACLKAELIQTNQVAYGFHAGSRMHMMTSDMSGLAIDNTNLKVHTWGRIAANDAPFTPLGEIPLDAPVSTWDCTTNGRFACYYLASSTVKFWKYNEGDSPEKTSDFRMIDRWERKLEGPKANSTLRLGAASLSLSSIQLI